MPGARVDLELRAHLAAHRTVERGRLVLPERHVALEPGVRDALRVVGVGGAAVVVRVLLEQAGKVLHAGGVKVAVLRVGERPLLGGHELGQAVARAAGQFVPGPAVEALGLDAAGEGGFVLDAAIWWRQEQWVQDESV